MPRPPTVSLARCVQQSRELRASAAHASPHESARLTHMAEAYDVLAARFDTPLRRRPAALPNMRVDPAIGSAALAKREDTHGRTRSAELDRGESDRA